MVFIASVAYAENLVDIDSPEFGEAVKAYLLENPEVIIDSLDAYEAKQAAIAAEEVKAKLIELEPKLFDETNAIVLGNPDGTIALVEFVDYSCQYCRKAHEALKNVLAKNDDVKVVVRQFPILSQGSLEAAQVAIAIIQSGDNEKAVAFHDQAYAVEGHIDLAKALEIAEGLGFKPEELQPKLTSPEILSEISLVSQMAHDLDISGTPGFILDGVIYPGYIPEDVLQQIIDEARAKE